MTEDFRRPNDIDEFSKSVCLTQPFGSFTTIKKLLKYTLYLLLVAIFFEGSARLALSWDWFFKRIEGDYDASWRLEWVKRHRDEGKEIYYKFDVYDPTKGWALKPGLHDEPAFDGKLLSSNSRGLRGKQEYSYEKPADKLRVLVIGDSYTFGDEVSDDETYCALLQDMMPHAEVINMGIHGYGHDQILIYLKEEGIRYKPDIVVLGFVYYDLFRNVLAFRDFAKPRFVRDGDSLVLTNSPVPHPETVLELDRRQSRFVDLVAILYHKVRSRLGLKEKEMKAVTTAILDEMVATVKTAGATPVFVYIPTGEEVLDPRRSAEWEGYFTGYCEGNKDVSCISLKPHFEQAVADSADLKFHGHWGVKGNLLIAGGIYEAVTSLR